MRSRKWIVIAVIVVAASALGLLYWRGRAIMQTGPSQYVTEQARTGDVIVTASGTGNLAPVRSRTLHATSTGKIAAIHISVGDDVTAGQALVELDNEEILAQYERSRMELESARLGLRDLLGLPAGAALPENLMKGTILESPSAGRIMNLQPREGERITAGSRVCEVIDDTHALIEVRVTPREAGLISEGDETTLYLHDFSGSYTAIVRHVDPDPSPTDEGVAMNRVVVMMENPRGLIKPGQAAEVRFHGVGVQRAGQVIQPPTQSIYAQVTGTVESVLVREGQLVQEEQTLLTISSPSHSVALSRQLLQIRQAELSVAGAERSLSALTMRSPIDGVVTAVHPDAGEEVTPGAPVVTVSDVNTFILSIDVDELDIPTVEIGLEATLKVDAFPGDTFTGGVESVSLAASMSNGVAVFPVRILLPGHPRLREGMSATAEIEVDRATDVLVVSAEAVTTSDGVSTVRVLTDEGIEVREVSMGISDGRHTEIVEGLDPGEEIIIASVGPQLPGLFRPGR